MIAAVIERARRRLFWNEIVERGSSALSVTMGVVVVLLLLGAEIVSYLWLIALAAVFSTAVAWRVVRRRPGGYTTAQLVDRRLDLSDTLSSALFFSTQPATGSADPARMALRDSAMRLCENLSLAKAVPLSAGRSSLAAGVLAFTAISLFALRYGVEHRLDIRLGASPGLQQKFD